MNYKLKLALGCIFALSASTTYGADLLEVYKKAQQADPQIREADATRLATLEGKPQAWAALLPQIDGTAGLSNSKQDTDGSPRVVDFDPNVAGGFIISTGHSETDTDTTR